MHKDGQNGIVEKFADLVDVVRELRVRCPWDREQTPESMARHLIEEAYEVSDALNRERRAELAEELGDLIVQLIFQAIAAEEQGWLRFETVLAEARRKLIRRHPHVYGDAQANSAAEVARQWEKIKLEEKRQSTSPSSLDDGAKSAIPSLIRAEKLGIKARALGMDWPDIRSVLAKVREELDEIDRALAAADRKEIVAEIGDALLALANAPRFYGSSAEETLRQACSRFTARFAEAERIASERGTRLADLSPDVVEAVWQEAKQRLAAHRSPASEDKTKGTDVERD